MRGSTDIDIAEVLDWVEHSVKQKKCSLTSVSLCLIILNIIYFVTMIKWMHFIHNTAIGPFFGVCSNAVDTNMQRHATFYFFY